MKFVLDEPNTGGSYLLTGNNTVPSQFKAINVKVTKLDEILKGETPIDVIQMDAEGAEYLIALGAENILKQSWAVTIVLEWEQENIRRNGKDPLEIVEWWKRQGFKFLMIRTEDIGQVTDFELKVLSGNIILTRFPQKFDGIKLK